VVRTPGGLLKRLGRVLLWALVVVLLLRGAASVVASSQPRTVVRESRPVAPAWPDDGVRAFAADFARAYLTYSPKDPEASATALRAFVAPDLASSVVPEYANDAPARAVASVSVARVARLDGSHALVTVTAAVNGASKYLTVPVARDARGGLVVSDLPSFTAPPGRAVVEAPMTQAVPAAEQPAIEDVVSRFLRSYLSGDAGALAYLVPPGTRAGALAQRLQLVDVDSLALAVPPAGRVRVVLASVRARDQASGATYQLGYRLKLVREDRWLVAALNDATRREG
jgi:hypothetical protein